MHHWEDRIRYISLFSGVGGLESAVDQPILCCELDEACAPVLRKRFHNVPIHPDVTTLHPPEAEVITGGWPCQDISVAGLRRGLSGERSGLFFEMLRVAREAEAHTIVAENVPNLLALERGKTFEQVLHALEFDGFPYVAWRTINAREFGLPHQRRRVFIVASKHPEIARALHRPYEHELPAHAETVDCGGFYWTAGLQSICYSRGFVPTLKLGSSLSIPSPPALYFDDCVRKAGPTECLHLQGFDPDDFAETAAKDIYRMSGNAVAVPVGHFVFDSVRADPVPDLPIGSFARIGESGLYEEGFAYSVEHASFPLANNLYDFIDHDDRTPISRRAAAGVVARLKRSGKPCPAEVWDVLLCYAGEETADVKRGSSYDCAGGHVVDNGSFGGGSSARSSKTRFENGESPEGHDNAQLDLLAVAVHEANEESS